MRKAELYRVHGNDERISLKNVHAGVRAYTELLHDAPGSSFRGFHMTTDEQSIRDLKTSEALTWMGVVRAERLLVCVLIWSFAALAVGGCATAPQSIPAPRLDEQIETGLRAYHQGHHDSARRVLRAALQEADRDGVEDLRVAAILNIITAIDTVEHYGSREWYAQQPIALDRMLAIAEKALTPEHPDLVLSLKTVAGLHLAKEKRAQAEPLVNRALAIEEKTLGPEHPTVAVTRLHWRAEIVLLRQRGEFAEVEFLHRQALNIQEKALGPEDPKLVESLRVLAGLYAIQGQHAQAESLLKRALAIQERALGPEHPDLAVTLGMLIRFYVELGKSLEESMVRRTAAFREKALGRGSVIMAGPLFRRSLEILDKAIRLPGVIKGFGVAAVVSFGQGQHAHGEALYNLTLAIMADGLGPEHRAVVQNLEHHAQLLRQANRDAEAATMEEHAKAIRAKHTGQNPAR